MSQIVVPLYINSKDRIDIEKKTTDFNILIRKDLNNIKNVNVTNVSVPNILTTINNTNNELSIGFYDGNKTFREIIILDIKNYDETTLSVEIENKLNASEVSSNFGLTWSVSFSSEKYTFQVDFLFGSVFSEWGINISYSRLLDYLGLSGGITTDIEYRVTSSSILLFESSGTTNLLPSLYYNITSDALTGDFNTSYINSLGKLFNITDENKEMVFKIEETLDNVTKQFPVINSVRGGGHIPFSGYNGGNFSKKHDVAVFSTNSADYPNGNSFVYDIENEIFTNYLKINGKVGTVSNNQFYGSCISGDGNNIFISIPDDNGETGGVIVFVKDKFENWTQQAVLTKSGSLSGDRYGFPLTCSNNGNVLIFTSLEVKEPAVFIRAGETWLENSNTMIPCNNVVVNNLGDVIAVSDFSFNSDRGRTVVYSFDYPNINPLSGDLIGSNQIDLHKQGFSLAMNNAGDVLAVGSNTTSITTSSVWLFRYDGMNWLEEESFASTNPVHSQYGLIVSLNGVGNVLSIAAETQFTDPIFSGRNRYGVHIWEYGTSWVNTAFDLSFSGQTAKRELIDIKSLELNNEGNSFWVTYSRDPDLGRSILYTKVENMWVYKRFNKAILTPQSIKNRGYAIHSRISENGKHLITSTNTQTNSFTTSRLERLVVIENTNDFIRDYAKQEGKNRNFGSVDISADGRIFVNLDTSGEAGVFVTEEDDLGFEQTNLKGIISLVTPLSLFNGEVIRISSDGTTIAVSDVIYNSNRGIVVILVKDGDNWVVQDTLTQPDTNVFFGRSIAISSDGNTLVVYTYDIGDCYQLWVYRKTDSIWTLSFKDTPSTQPIGGSRQGNVSVSGDGSRVVACSYSLIDNAGVVFVYDNEIRSELVTTENHGESVEISADGTLIADSIKIWTPNEPLVLIWRFNNGWIRNDYDIMSNLSFLSGEEITVNGESAKSLSIAQVNGGYIISVGFPLYHSIYYTYVNVPVVFERRRSIDINTFYTVFGITQKLNEVLTNLPLEETVETKFTFDKETGIIRVDFISSLNDATYSIDVNSSLLQSIYTFLNVINNNQSDIVVDLSINNNVIKTINIYNDSHDAIINYDGVVENTFRPYKPGFFINIEKNIDIQVRNERDQIIDLRGIDIAMTVLISL